MQIIFFFIAGFYTSNTIIDGYHSMKLKEKDSHGIKYASSPNFAPWPYLYLFNYQFLWKYTWILFCSESIFNHKKWKINQNIFKYNPFFFFYDLKLIPNKKVFMYIFTKIYSWKDIDRAEKQSEGLKHVLYHDCPFFKFHWMASINYVVRCIKNKNKEKNYLHKK